MRTVSFSDPKLQNILNRQFVNTYTNTVGDPTAGKSIRHRPNESPGPCLRGNGKQNVQTIFMTPKGEIFHVATGYQSSDDLIEETRFALDLFQKIRTSSPINQKQIVSDSHQRRLSSPTSNNRSPFSEFDNMVSSFMPNGRRGNANNGSRTKIPGSEMMNRFAQMGFDNDQRFSIKHPMLTHTELERNPAKLVGEGTSFFASSGFGSDRFSK